MARSKFIWSVTYDDYTVDWVKAQTVWQILDCDKLSNGIDNIISINRVELVGGWADEEYMIDIPFHD